MVKSEWGVDMILGGHPHSVLDMSIEVNGILEYNWRLVPINEQAAESDLGLHQYIGSFKEVVDWKHNTISYKFTDRLVHLRQVALTVFRSFQMFSAGHFLAHS